MKEAPRKEVKAELKFLTIWKNKTNAKEKNDHSKLQPEKKHQETT